ncbi:MAG: hypothetical protein ACFFHD_05595 [Promethearchaeota archaeon]
MKKISEEQIKEIIYEINNHKTIGIKKQLNELEDCKEQEILDDLKRLIRNNGRSNMISKSDLEEIRNKYN